MNATPSITCPKCQRTSYNANDIREGYCGHCKSWTAKARVKPSPCPACGAVHDCATTVGAPPDCQPMPEDLSVCFNCGELLRFNADLTRRRCDLNDLMTLDDVTRTLLYKTQAAIRRLRRAGKL